MRHICNYEQGNYVLLRENASTFDWNSLGDNNINVFADNVNTVINSLASECIPNKHVRNKHLDPPCITFALKRYLYVNVSALIKEQNVQI